MSYGGSNDDFGPKPVEAGKEYDVQITEISRKGDGIARIQGFVIFVKEGRVGQNAKIRISQIGPRFATAEIIDGSTTSPNESTS
jgi:predicted RNA-binding protein with TRAM domain